MPDGSAVLRELARRSERRIHTLTAHLSTDEVDELLAAMETIHRLLDLHEEPT